MEHAWDFYKPNPSSPYPLVDGRFSNSCYLRALDKCYERWVAKYRGKYGKEVALDGGVDYVVLHAPYNKLTQKGYARLHYSDHRIAETVRHTPPPTPPCPPSPPSPSSSRTPTWPSRRPA